MAATVVVGLIGALVAVGLIGALVAEAAGSIAGRQLYRNRCVPQEADKPLGPKPDFGLAEILSLDTFNDAGP
jgi:hypothetical protein